MTTIISVQDALAAVHDAIRDGGRDGLTVPSIAVMLSLTEQAVERILVAGADRGVFSRINNRWVAWGICRTCGYGALDRYYADYHPSPAACETNPVDYCAGYPLPANT